MTGAHACSTLGCLDHDLEPADGGKTMPVRPLDADQVIARLVVLVRGDGVAVLGVAGRRCRRCAPRPCGLPSPKSQVSSPSVVRNVRTMNVTGSPGLMPYVGAVGGVDRRRQLLGLVRIEHVDDGEIVVDPARGVGDLQDLAVDAGLRVGALAPWRRWRLVPSVKVHS